MIFNFRCETLFRTLFYYGPMLNLFYSEPDCNLKSYYYLFKCL
ncbi:hypothetical protein U9M48_000728 [Paspalum notatum var. saurae]|uniref:Uncharacterized protein n=1 Tax=Paspalum notatum var. saurae TaxID=547442 RepID=A0AAQ3PHC1_PASNO